MLHLVGYTHDDDADWELMTQEEKRILKLVRNACCAYRILLYCLSCMR